MHNALRQEDNQVMNASNQISKTAGFDAIFIAAKFSMTPCMNSCFCFELAAFIGSTMQCKSSALQNSSLKYQLKLVDSNQGLKFQTNNQPDGSTVQISDA